MNGPILLGNGFDLAHAAKTRYSDFLSHYIKQGLVEISTSASYRHGIMQIDPRNLPYKHWTAIKRLQDIFQTITPVLRKPGTPRINTPLAQFWIMEH